MNSSFLHRLSVRAKLLAMMVVSAASLVLLAIFFLAVVNEVKVSGPIYAAIAREMDLRSDILPPPEFIVKTHLTVLQMEKALRTNPQQREALKKKLESLKHDYDDRQSYWKSALPSGTPLELQIRDGILKQSKDPAERYFAILDQQFFPAILQDDPVKAAAIVDTQLEPLYVQHKAAIEKLADLTQQSQDLRVEQARQEIAFRITALAILIVISLLLTISVGVYLLQSITSPLGDAVSALQSVARRDLTPRLQIRNQDEVGAMAQAFNVATEAIRTGFSQVGTIAKLVSHVSSQLDKAAGLLSEGTQTQAASLEETSASLEQLTATVKQNAGFAMEARDLAKNSSDTAFEGTRVIQSAIVAMQEISAASIRIGEITASIDEISFHTNILAVNAAIEAARAGEQGLGFAVVAKEVRSLAERSAASAREIKGLIKDTVEKVAKGSAHVNRSGETLQDIAGSVQRVASVIADISTACNEQANAIENVSSAVVGVDSVTQRNAVQSEELFSNARQLLTKAQELDTIVSSFKMERKQSSKFYDAPATRPVNELYAEPALLETAL